MKKIFLLLIFLTTLSGFSQENYKIFVTGNIFYIQNTSSNVLYEGLKNEVLAKKELSSSTSYSFRGVNGWDASIAIPFATVTDKTNNNVEINFAERGKPLILSGVAEAMAIDLNNATITGGSIKISIEFTEE